MTWFSQGGYFPAMPLTIPDVLTGGVPAPDPAAEADGAPLIVDGGGYTFGDPVLETIASALAADKVGDAGYELTGTITPDGTNIVTIAGEAAPAQIKVGDRITINGTTKTVLAKAGSVLTLDGTVGAGAADTTPDVLPAIEALVDNTGLLRYVVRSDSVIQIRYGSLLIMQFSHLDTGGAIIVGDTALQLVLGNKWDAPHYIEVIPSGSVLNFGNLAGSCPVNFTSFIKRSKAEAQTATGTDLATAFALAADFTEFGTVASGTGCKAVANADGLTILNNGANALLFYAETGATVDGAASYSIPAGQIACFRRLSTTRWFTVWGT